MNSEQENIKVVKICIFPFYKNPEYDIMYSVYFQQLKINGWQDKF